MFDGLEDKIIETDIIIIEPIHPGYRVWTYGMDEPEIYKSKKKALKFVKELIFAFEREKDTECVSEEETKQNNGCHLKLVSDRTKEIDDD